MPEVQSDRPDGCICDYNPDTTQGPDETCPHHGRPYAYWVEGCEQLGRLLDAERARADAAEAKVARVEALAQAIRNGHASGNSGAVYAALSDD